MPSKDAIEGFDDVDRLDALDGLDGLDALVRQPRHELVGASY